MINLINGKQIATKIFEEIENKAKGKTLAIILASDDASSKLYVDLKTKKAESIGIKVQVHHFGKEVMASKIIEKITELNDDMHIDGVLIQLPFYDHLKPRTNLILNSLDYTKDVDGITPYQQGLSSHLFIGSRLPAAVEAVIECFNSISDEDLSWDNITRNPDQIEYFKGKKVLIVNNSNLIGKPLSNVLCSLNATVTIANSFSHNLSELSKDSDIIVSATGKTNLIDASMIKQGAILVDVTSEKVNGQVKGDFIVSDELVLKAAYLTPVPGGIGPITIACLLRNLA